MKKTLLLLLTFGLILTARAQDRIITNEGNRYEGKVTDIKNDTVYFQYTFKGHLRKLAIPESEIQERTLHYKLRERKAFLDELELPRWRVTFEGGAGKRIARLSPMVTNPNEVAHLRALTFGYNLDFQTGYFFNEMEGIGVQYNLFKSSNEAISGGQVLADNYAIHYIGLNYLMRRAMPDNLSILYFSLGSGVSHYYNQGLYQNLSLHIKGTTLGFNAQGGADFQIAKNVYLGAGLRLNAGVLRSIKVGNGFHFEKIKLNENSYENLARVDANLGLRILID
ncbi:porin family protein [Pleomorphovibrio marinus]|uniref:hypothetical protein n=1 Tax=Pleomorphovibrio marinus TaxID=2164132 RepID=UPI000E0C296D|nr:hypothetical protein [Pleomorphovibrio marinus]